MLTFDDNVNNEAFGYYKRLFISRRTNPDGCPIKSTFFVTGHGTDFGIVKTLHRKGFEIAVHSISHRFPASWWATASYDEYYQEIIGMKEQLVTKAGIPKSEVTGFRVPFLQIGGDTMFKVLEKGGFTHDSSIYAAKFDPPLWPYKLDKPPHGRKCLIYPCPRESYANIWEFPIQPWYTVSGQRCSMTDEPRCQNGDTLTYLKYNFKRYYQSNRAPFSIYIHYYWLRKESNLRALEQFIDEVLNYGDVYFLTQNQVLDWIRLSKSTIPTSC